LHDVEVEHSERGMHVSPGVSKLMPESGTAEGRRRDGKGVKPGKRVNPVAEESRVAEGGANEIQVGCCVSGIVKCSFSRCLVRGCH